MQSVQLLDSVIKLCFQRLNANLSFCIGSSRIRSLSPLKKHQGLMVVPLMLPSSLLSPENFVLRSFQVAFQLSLSFLSLLAVDFGVDPAPVVANL